MPTASYVDYARVMLALPARADQVAERVGMTVSCVRLILRQLWSLRMAHPGEAEGARNNVVAVWLQGDGDAAPGVRGGGRLKPGAQLIAFATIWRALDGGARVSVVFEETGVSRDAVYRLLGFMRKAGGAHITTWEKDRFGRAVAVWTLGEGRDAPRPKLRTAGEIARQYNRRLQYRTLMGIAGQAA